MDAVVSARRIRHDIASIVTGTPAAENNVLPEWVKDLEPNPSAVNHLICVIYMNPNLRAKARTLKGADAVAFMDELQSVSHIKLSSG